MEQLCGMCGYGNAKCIEAFRRGASIVGPLERSGHYRAVCEDASLSVEELIEQRKARNTKLIESLKMDKHVDKLLAMTKEDAEKGRMSEPRPLTEADLVDYDLSPRFLIVQGALLCVCVSCMNVWPQSVPLAVQA